MPTIIATAGDPTANSYVTTDEFFAYADMRLGIDWATLTDPDVSRALLQSCLIIDEFDYIGEAATDTQALKWPRVEDDLFTDNDRDFPFDDDEIPQRLKYAQIEVALSLLEEDSSGASASSQPVSSLTIGSTVKVEYDSATASVAAVVDPQNLPIAAARMLKGLRMHPVLA